MYSFTACSTGFSEQPLMNVHSYRALRNVGGWNDMQVAIHGVLAVHWVYWQDRVRRGKAVTPHTYTASAHYYTFPGTQQSNSHSSLERTIKSKTQLQPQVTLKLTDPSSRPLPSQPHSGSRNNHATASLTSFLCLCLVIDLALIKTGQRSHAVKYWLRNYPHPYPMSGVVLSQASRCCCWNLSVMYFAFLCRVWKSCFKVAMAAGGHFLFFRIYFFMLLSSNDFSGRVWIYFLTIFPLVIPGICE